mmetsp:Transcript_13964/g.48653  ORF Transcript_13964/g.48653 Transcript_13964/m.48653 type:complete len:489 (-) Transcript_13964:3273-4739(-)
MSERVRELVAEWQVGAVIHPAVRTERDGVAERVRCRRDRHETRRRRAVGNDCDLRGANRAARVRGLRAERVHAARHQCVGPQLDHRHRDGSRQLRTCDGRADDGKVERPRYLRPRVADLALAGGGRAEAHLGRRVELARRCRHGHIERGAGHGVDAQRPGARPQLVRHVGAGLALRRFNREVVARVGLHRPSRDQHHAVHVVLAPSVKVEGVAVAIHARVVGVVDARPLERERQGVEAVSVDRAARVEPQRRARAHRAARAAGDDHRDGTALDVHVDVGEVAHIVVGHQRARDADGVHAFDGERRARKHDGNGIARLKRGIRQRQKRRHRLRVVVGTSDAGVLERVCEARRAGVRAARGWLAKHAYLDVLTARRVQHRETDHGHGRQRGVKLVDIDGDGSRLVRHPVGNGDTEGELVDVDARGWDPHDGCGHARLRGEKCRQVVVEGRRRARGSELPRVRHVAAAATERLGRVEHEFVAGANARGGWQ